MNKLNIEENFNKLNNIANTEIEYNKIQDYENNYEYKQSYINIDSRTRITLPQNIIKMESGYLDSNPITCNNTTNTNTTSNSSNSSNIVRINTTAKFNVGDKIVLQNIVGKTIILNNPIYLISNYNYYMVNMNNHNIKPEYTDLEDYRINVELYESASETDRLIGNIPLNSIVGIKRIYVYNNNELFLSDAVKNRILNELNISTTDLINNYFFVNLPFNYININNVNTDTQFNPFQQIQKIFKFTFNTIGCINTYYLNANYPINIYQYQPFHEVTATGSNYIEFISSAYAFLNETGGGDNVLIGKVLNTIEGYPDANEYTIFLKKTFTDVIKLELVSCEIPYINNNITNNITTNNKLYWKILEDGDYIYSISLLEGNYFIDSIADILKNKMNSIERIGSSPKDIIYNEFDINYSTDSQEFKFISYKTNKLSYSLNLEQDLSIGSEVLRLTIVHPNNYVNIGDTIIISNSTDIGSISSTLINKSHTVYSINKEASTYSVLLSTTQYTSTMNIIGDGGAKTTIKTPILASFLFNYNDTIGELLGFKYVGQPSSITPYSHITSNLNNYILSTPYNSVGNRTKQNNYFNLPGQNYYMLMYLNDYENIYTTNNNNYNYNNAFTKILMDGYPGDILFNTFICSSLIFDIPLKILNELKIKFLYPDGTKPDFRNLNHSFTLKVTERLSKPVRTGLNSMKMNYLDSLKEFSKD